MVYSDKDAWAVRQDYDDFDAYVVANPNAPTVTHIIEMLEEATEIINAIIPSYNVDITDTRFASYLSKLTLRMVDRMRQVDLGQGKFTSIPFFSPNDFLIERERLYLMHIGVVLGYRRVGGVS